MKHFKDVNAFNKQMQIVKEILEDKGYIVESDHPYANAMQYNNAFEDVRDWLQESDYCGTVTALGHFAGVAVYGLYDTEKISYEEMHKALDAEAKGQMELI